MNRLSPDTLMADTDFVSRLTRIRQDIHAHPETAFEEFRTAEIVAHFLEELGLDVHRGLAKTAVIGTLRGRHAGNRTIGLRADMDALFINEQTGKPYASTVPGKMHACGHDGHTTMLLGAAEKLAGDPDFAGTVHFIFQPAEEALGGANVMIKEGFLAQFPCDEIYGLHNAPQAPLGRFETRAGAFMSAGDTWEMQFRGAGGHGAMPHKAVDPTVPAGQFIAALSSIVTRKVPINDPAVISVGHIAAGDYNSPNIIPSEVTIRGTARSYSPATRDILEEAIAALGKSCAEPFGVTSKLIYSRRYPSLINSAKEVQTAARAAQSVLGAENVNADAEPIGGSEDFAYFLQEVPGAYVIIGNGDGPASAFVHTPKYDFNDDLIPYGVSYWLSLVAEAMPAPAGR